MTNDIIIRFLRIYSGITTVVAIVFLAVLYLIGENNLLIMSELLAIIAISLACLYVSEHTLTYKAEQREFETNDRIYDILSQQAIMIKQLQQEVMLLRVSSSCICQQSV